MITRFEKLVRDGIPAMIEANGEVAEVRFLDAEELKNKLADKLIEEGTEVGRAVEAGDRGSVVEELADLEEVRLALLRLYEVGLDEVEEVRKKKLVDRGGFERGVFLVQTVSRTDGQG